MLRLFTLVFLALGGPAAASSPIAEVICAPRAEMEQRLTVQYGASRVGSGIRGPEEVIEIWSSEATGNWTLVMRYAGGQSCIAAMGEAWMPAAVDPA